jgi:RTX calcium-binding nonapeptide repeat (4 copies)
MRSLINPGRPFRLISTAAVLGLAAIATPAVSSASTHKVQDVRAKLTHDGTLEVNGGHRGNAVALRLGDRTQVQVDVGDDGSADFTFARSDLGAIKVNMGSGNDAVRIDDTNGAFTDSIPTTIAGGAGNDSLIGGAGAETFLGGDGNDTVAGGKGNDTAYLGDGNDVFSWDPGEGSDVIDGQGGSDRMLFNGGAGADTVTMTANFGRLTFFRDPGNVTMDTDNVETVDFNALGGPDSVTVSDLTGTDVEQTNLDLAAELGGSAADGAIDNVVVNGTKGDDTINVDGSRAGVDVTGLATAVSIKHADPTDSLSINTITGENSVIVNGVAGLMQLLIDGIPAA